MVLDVHVAINFLRIQFSLQCIRDRSPPHHMPSECGMKQALMVLSELETFLSISSTDSRERKNRQKLLRNLKVPVIEPNSILLLL